MLPLITSHETVITMEWIMSDESHRQFWLDRALDLQREGMELAILRLSNLLNDYVAHQLRSDEPLANALVEPMLKRINFFELAVAFLNQVVDAEYFSNMRPGEFAAGPMTALELT